jgi:hypothetical protein
MFIVRRFGHLMRLSRVALILLLPLLVACKLMPQGADQRPDAGQDGISETALTDGENQAANTGIRPKPRPGSVVEAAAVPEVPSAEVPNTEAATPAEAVVVEPVVEKSKEQITCEKRGGTWGAAGKSGGKTCIKQTRDGGKECSKQSNCESVCLARSRTCAPVKPLFGCNEILQDDGRRVTLCID